MSRATLNFGGVDQSCKTCLIGGVQASVASVVSSTASPDELTIHIIVQAQSLNDFKVQPCKIPNEFTASQCFSEIWGQSHSWWTSHTVTVYEKNGLMFHHWQMRFGIRPECQATVSVTGVLIKVHAVPWLMRINQSTWLVDVSKGFYWPVP